MLFLAAAALLVVTVANAHHTPEHKLQYPQFVVGKTHLYEVLFNVTSGVPGLKSQVSKSVINAELKIFAKSERELILSMHKVLVSNALPSVESAEEKVNLKPDSALEQALKTPFKAIYEDGKVKSYTLDPSEKLESQKLKRTVLRHLEVYLDQKALQSGSQHWKPITYNVTRSSPYGNYYSHYVVTSSPYVQFPAELSVYNVTRADNYEPIAYMAHKTDNNFERQGCPEVCKKDHIENRFGAGCPVTYEPYQAPMKRSFVQHHNMRQLENGNTILDIIRTKETHVADLYDQNMEVVIRTLLKFKKAVTETIPEPTGQQTHENLDDMSMEINEKEIAQMCGFTTPAQAMEMAKRILDQIAEVVIEGSVENVKAKKIGELIISLQKSMARMTEGDLRSVQNAIKNFDDLQKANEHEKVKRQVWVDMLPLIGTKESVRFIVQLIEENMNRPNRAISLWEAKSMLEELPMNIRYPTKEMVVELSKLLELINDREKTGYTIFHSASHLAVARVIRQMCATDNGIPEEELSQDSSDEPQSYTRAQMRLLRKSPNQQMPNPDRCPEETARQFVEQIAQKLRSTNDKAKRIIYIETLAKTGLDKVLPILAPIVNGHIPGASDLSHSYIDYLRTVTLYALHNVVSRHPRQVENIVLPVFFNTTEPPKIRAAAFSNYIRSTPTLGSLQHVAESTWREPSQEIASYVTTTLETFGNATIPCHQLTAIRIKKILPQIKRTEMGVHNAKNLLWTLWDSVRGFGLEKRFEMMPSNESWIPSTWYGALGYNADSLNDIFFQYASTMQGFTSRNVWDEILNRLGLNTADDIPNEKESKIFEDLEVAVRDPEFWRFTLYQKFFYATSFYTFDEEDSSRGDIISLVLEEMTRYLTQDSQGNYEGHLVKVYIPSQYRSKAISKALPYPVSFHMTNPLLISIKAKVQRNTERQSSGYRMHIRPNVYYSTVYTNQMLNLGDCKSLGVYHVKQIAASYPVVVGIALENGKIEMSYQFPDLPKKIFSYHSEAGTYAGKKQLVVLPPEEDRRTIHTIPSQFKKHLTWGLVGMPPFEADVLTEDIQFGKDPTPRNVKEAIHQFVKHFLNAGWRKKTVVISRVPDNNIWPMNTQVRLRLGYEKEYVSVPEARTEDWSQGLKFEDNLSSKDVQEYAAEGQKLYEKLTRTLNHYKNKFTVSVEQIEKSSSAKTAYLKLEHRHTLSGFLHQVHANMSVNFPKILDKLDVAFDYAVAFINRPNEFNYNEQSYGKQKGLALGSISFNNVAPFRKPAIVGKAVFDYLPMEEYLRNEMESVDRKDFLPEDYEQCKTDMQNGKTLTVPCMKTMREHAIFNNLRMHAIWPENTIPRMVEVAAEKFDLALKHAFYPHMELFRKPTPRSMPQLRLHATFIDKMTDEPVVDITLDKPKETLKFKKVDVQGWYPISSMDKWSDVVSQQLTNNTYPATCALMNKHVRTYDLKTYKMPRDVSSCKFLLTAQCTEYKKFAVVVQHDTQKGETEEVHIYLGGDEIILTNGGRQGQEFTVKYNGQETRVQLFKPVMLDEENEVYALVNMAYPRIHTIEIHAKMAGIRVVYDRHNVKVKVHPRYKGELCGLCSEFNGEVSREYRGPDRCLYSDAEDFARSSIIGQCQNKETKFPKLCNDDEINGPAQSHRRHDQSRRDDEDEQQRRRNQPSWRNQDEQQRRQSRRENEDDDEDEQQSWRDQEQQSWRDQDQQSWRDQDQQSWRDQDQDEQQRQHGRQSWRDQDQDEQQRQHGRQSWRDQDQDEQQRQHGRQSRRDQDQDEQQKRRDEQSRYGQDDDEDQQQSSESELPIKRNAVYERQGQFCFTVKPVPVCQEQRDPKETEEMEVELHCLPKQDRNARKLVTESRRRILGELESKSVDHVEVKKVAKRC